MGRSIRSLKEFTESVLAFDAVDAYKDPMALTVVYAAGGYISIIPGFLTCELHPSDTVINSLNNPEIREITVSSYSATGTARGLAKLYGILANGGTYQGKQLLSKEVIEKLSTTVIEGFDVVIQADGVKYGPGVQIKLNPWGQTVYGHTGHGGQVAMADPSNDLGIAYITNFISIYAMGDDPRYLDLEKAAYEGLRKYQARKKKS